MSLSFRWTALFLSAAAVLTTAAANPAFGQRRDESRGGPGGGFRGRGGPEGGFRGRGGPGGGFRGGGGPADFLRRLDTNGNGAIDPSEAEGRAGFFLQRIASEVPGIDLSRPVPIDRLVREMERMRGGASRDSGPSDQRDSRSSPGSGSSASSSPATEPLVPGFGVETVLPPVPGFGEAGELYAVRVTDQDRQTAEERFRRYDRNGDGKLDGDELRGGRWGEDPMQYDRNRDGVLTASELAVRYAQRRVADEQQRSGGSTARSSSGPSAPSRPSSGGPDRSRGPSPDGMAGMVDRLFERFDANRNGVLEKNEWPPESSFFNPAQADGDGNGRIERQEMTNFMANRSREWGSWGRGRGEGGDRRRGMFAGGRPGEGGGPGPSAESRPDPEKKDGNSGGSTLVGGRVDPRKSYKLGTATDRLAKLDLPPWFSRDDANQDGQVMMAEFAAAWSDSVANEFTQFDLNGDGVITPRECLKATENGAIRGGGGGGVAAAAPVSPTPVTPTQVSPRLAGNGPTSPVLAVANTAAAAPPSTASGTNSSETAKAAPAVSPPTAPSAAAGGNVDPRLIQYAVQVIKKYDSNRDQMLTAEEWSKMPKNLATADADGDGRITPQELAQALAR